MATRRSKNKSAENKTTLEKRKETMYANKHTVKSSTSSVVQAIKEHNRSKVSKLCGAAPVATGPLAYQSPTDSRYNLTESQLQWACDSIVKSGVKPKHVLAVLGWDDGHWSFLNQTARDSRHPWHEVKQTLEQAYRMHELQTSAEAMSSQDERLKLDFYRWHKDRTDPTFAPKQVTATFDQTSRYIINVILQSAEIDNDTKDRILELLSTTSYDNMLRQLEETNGEG